MITFKDVAYCYTGEEENIFSDVNFSLEAGSYHFLTGPSGSGKTSLINLLNLASLPTHGSITMMGQELSNITRKQMADLRKKIGVVFQDFRLISHLSTFDNVALPLRIQKRDKTEIEHNVTELLEWVGLGEFKDKNPENLSGGQQQRIAIARAIISQPKLLLADEPTGNLDDEIGFRLMNLFEQLNRMGTTIVIATHNPAIIKRFKHPCLRFENATIIQSSKNEKIRDVL